MDREKFIVKNCGDRWGKTNDEADKFLEQLLPLEIEEENPFFKGEPKIFIHGKCYSAEEFEKEYLMKFQEVNEKESFCQKV